MKARSAGLITHHGEAVQSRAWCWKVTPLEPINGTAVFGFTSIDADLIIDGITYAAATGFTPSSIDGKADMSVPNLEVAGLLSSASITESDLLAGRWDGAAVEIFEVNHRDLTQGVMNLRSGTIGSVSAGRVSFTAELRGVNQVLQQSVGELFTAGCPATLGDARCKVNLASFTHAGTVTEATSAQQFTDSGIGQADDYFCAGKVTWTTGLNAGLSMEVRTFDGSVFVFALPMPFAISAGDTFSAVAGCRKRHQRSNVYNPAGISDCLDKFNNVPNYQGHPFVPGNDKLLGNGALASV